MALIKCPECSREISDKAVACPHCGFPIQEYLASNDSISLDDSHHKDSPTWNANIKPDEANNLDARPSEHPQNKNHTGAVVLVICACIAIIIAVATAQKETPKSSMITPAITSQDESYTTESPPEEPRLLSISECVSQMKRQLTNAFGSDGYNASQTAYNIIVMISLDELENIAYSAYEGDEDAINKWISAVATAKQIYDSTENSLIENGHDDVSLIFNFTSRLSISDGAITYNALNLPIDNLQSEDIEPYTLGSEDAKVTTNYQQYLSEHHISLNNFDVQYDLENNKDNLFSLEGTAELSDYYNYGYSNVESTHFCLAVTPSGGGYTNRWYIYCHRDSFSSVFAKMKEQGTMRVQMVCKISRWNKNQGCMAELQYIVY